jgi:ribosome-binding ATPase YchF (GTP1/OBG family)
MELVLADLESVEKRLPRIEKLARQKDKTAEMEVRILTTIKELRCHQLDQLDQLHVLHYHRQKHEQPDKLHLLL